MELIQVLLDFQGFLPPAPQLPELVCHELLPQVVIELAGLFLGLLYGFYLKQNRADVRGKKLVHRREHICAADGGRGMGQLDSIFPQQIDSERASVSRFVTRGH